MNFNEEKVLIITFQNLLNDTEKTMKKIFDFLNVNDTSFDFKKIKIPHKK